MISNIYSAAQGLSTGQSLVASRSQENSVRAGKNNLWTATFQINQALTVLDLAGKVCAAASRPFLSLAAKRAFYLMPFAVSIVIGYTQNETVQHAAHLIQNRLGTLYQGISAVLVVSMVFFGHTYYASAALFVLIIGYLDRHGALPEQMRHALHTYADPILFTLSLFTSTSSFDFVFSLFFLISSIDTNFAEKPLPEVDSPAETNFLKPLMFRDIASPQCPPLEIKQSHLLEIPSPPAPEADIMTLLTMFDAIPWNQPNQDTLRTYLSVDPRFLAAHQTIKGKSHEMLLQYAKANLETLLTTIQNRHIPDGEPTDYERALDYLKVIAHVLATEDDEAVKITQLLLLAVNGGEYCGPGKYEIIEKVYGFLVLKKENVPLRTKLLLCLQDYRRSLFDRVYYGQAHREETVLKYLLIDTFDLHQYNTHVRALGKRFAMHKLAADHDTIALVDSLTRRLYKWVKDKPYRDCFENNHTTAKIVQYTQDLLGSARLSKEAFLDHFKGWVGKNIASKEGQEKLTKAIDDGYLEITDVNEFYDWLKRQIRKVGEEGEQNIIFAHINPWKSNSNNKAELSLAIRTQVLKKLRPGTREKVARILDKADAGIIQTSYIEAFLVDMGVLEAPTADPYRSGQDHQLNHMLEGSPDLSSLLQSDRGD